VNGGERLYTKYNAGADLFFIRTIAQKRKRHMAVYESKNESHVAKLSDSNYRIWKTEMKWYLRSKRLVEYALVTVTVSADATEGEKKTFRVNDDKAIAAIGLHIEPNQQIHIEDCENAHEA